MLFVFGLNSKFCFHFLFKPHQFWKETDKNAKLRNFKQMSKLQHKHSPQINKPNKTYSSMTIAKLWSFVFKCVFFYDCVIPLFWECVICVGWHKKRPGTIIQNQMKIKFMNKYWNKKQSDNASNVKCHQSVSVSTKKQN